MKNKLINTLMIVLLILSLIGCTKQTDTSKNINDKKSIQEQKVENHEIGDQVELPLAKVSVTNVRKLNTKNTVYAVEVEIKNTSKQDLQSNFMENYTLKTVEDRKGEAINNQDLKGELLMDTIKPGDKLKGEIAYELENNDSPATFQICYDNKDYTIFNIKDKK